MSGREIKFRVWANNDEFPRGKMYYAEDSNPPFLLNMQGDLIRAIHDKDRMYKLIWARIGYNWELMQFTGLKDCKRTEEYPEGQEIYEGDILRDELGAGVVKWVQEHCSFLVFTTEPSKYYHLSCDGQLKKSEVIGNTFENPELMGGKE